MNVEQALKAAVPLDKKSLEVLTRSELNQKQLETLAQRSRQVTLQRFGNVMQLYAPLYISNECINICTYCGFSRDNKIARRTLSVEEIVVEAETLKKTGIRHILIVAGEHAKHIHLDYLCDIVRSLKNIFSFISLEIAPLKKQEYQKLCEAGVSGLVLYQETYNLEIYKQLHVAGPKKDYQHRLQAPFEGAQAGVRSLGLGCLYGLAPWQDDFLSLMEHARKIQKDHWRTSLSFSFPRLQEAQGVESAAHPLSDRDLVKAICLARLAFPESPLVLSTRETAQLRNQLALLGITQMSAGSRTDPGGYTLEEKNLEQFSIHDDRSVAQVKQSLTSLGFDVSQKDWEESLHGALN